MNRIFLATLAYAAVLAVAPAAGAASLGEFGRCLGSKGATFYGTSWCPYCQKQKETLGDALSGVRYVECSVNGSRDKTAAACTSAKVNSYPTWTFADGTRASGALSLDALAAKTGCDLPSTGRWGGKPVVKKSSNPKGPKIIEVPPE